VNGTQAARGSGLAPMFILERSHRAQDRRPAAVHRRGRVKDMAKTNPVEFLQQVRAEGAKVTWPSRKETMITTAMVFLMVVLASLFFLVADQVLRWVVSLILGLGS
jgi:preprotein translocase subunit SecE